MSLEDDCRMSLFSNTAALMALLFLWTQRKTFTLTPACWTACVSLKVGCCSPLSVYIHPLPRPDVTPSHYPILEFAWKQHLNYFTLHPLESEGKNCSPIFLFSQFWLLSISHLIQLLYLMLSFLWCLSPDRQQILFQKVLSWWCVCVCV